MPQSDNESHTNIPLEIWYAIAEFLTIQDLLNASATCKSWYMSMATEKIWKASYKVFMKGYSLDHFLVPDQVKNVRRHTFIQFNSLQTTKFECLEDWTKSWKQRSVFLNHVLKIQNEVVSALQQRTPEVFAAMDASIYDASSINRMEEYLGASFPIDFVLFMMHFAHYLTMKEYSWWPLVSLASGISFQNANWRSRTSQIQFRSYENEQSERGSVRVIHHTTCDFLTKTKFVCMASPRKVGPDLGEDCLTLLIQNASEGHDQVPDVLKTDSLMADCKAIKQGLGKVFIITDRWSWSRGVYYVSESFTDYLLQYAASLLTVGPVPPEGISNSTDFFSRLPKLESLRPSVLFPQPNDYNIASYMPLCLSWDRMNYPDLAPSLENGWESSDPTITSNIKFDNPERIAFHGLSDDLIAGFDKRNWVPYYSYKASQDVANLPKSLLDVKLQTAPITKTVQIDREIYEFLQRKIEDWYKSTPCTTQASAISDDYEFQLVKRKTRSLQHVFTMFQSRLPIEVYYNRNENAAIYLYTYKYYRDHLACLEQNHYKYSQDELRIIFKRLISHLNQLRSDYQNPVYLRRDKHVRKGQPKKRYLIDASQISEINWSEVHDAASDTAIFDDMNIRI
ncbi:hypothetical protein NQZ79_g7515 [Umbelopsis isabellina]|nr:hypothetical protein NQZ79_g7515 [Umbelopsis isabellina]